MSVKKNSKKDRSSEEQTEENVVLILRFMGWVFAVLIAGIILIVLYKAITGPGDFMDDLNEAITTNYLALALIFAVGSGLSFGSSSQIVENPLELKSVIVRNLIISMVIFGVIAVISVAFWQPIPF